ncbi:hypothetical protein [Pseudovibrio sp. Tun.PSC04-5.I4]|nr:hypothetical protein [Pseudovibrio sp. Tun.PSC04-5.I4]
MRLRDDEEHDDIEIGEEQQATFRCRQQDNISEIEVLELAETIK